MPDYLNEKIKNSISSISEKYLIDKVVLFGSRARGDNNPTSDIDLAVYPLPGFKSRGHFFSEIDDIETLLKIDLVFINEYTDSKLLDLIEKEGVIIYERSPN